MTLQAVSGALAIYLLVGLLFAWAVGFVATIDTGPYFANGHDASGGSIVYFSFTVLTTTGFGDIIPAHPVARMLCVLEQVIGVLFIAILIARLAGTYPPVENRR